MGPILVHYRSRSRDHRGVLYRVQGAIRRAPSDEVPEPSRERFYVVELVESESEEFEKQGAAGAAVAGAGWCEDAHTGVSV